MLTFITRRLLAGIATLFVAIFLMYLLVDLAIDPLADLREYRGADKAARIAAREDMLNLDTNVVVRFFQWLGHAFQGDFGIAWRSGQDVGTMVSHAIGSTLQLVTAATVLSLILGVSVGIVSALRQYATFDYLIIFLSFLLYSLPSFWVAVLLKQWGAIGFNDFLADPALSIPVLIGIAALMGLLWVLAIGGSVTRRLQTFGLAFAATLGVMLYVQLTDWWSRPQLGPVLIALTGVGFAFALTALSAGLKNRRALYTALATVAIGVALYYPLQGFFDSVAPSHLMMFGLALVAIGVGVLVGYLFRGPDWGVSARTGGITAFVVAAMIYIDRVMQVWPAYVNSNAINGRPIATFGDRTPNLGGNYWVQVLDQYTHLLLPTLTLILVAFAGYTRYSRSSMLEVMSQDYIRTARAKGLSERTVIMRHGFRNSLIPLATIVPIDVITLIGGAVVTERIFNRPGMGALFLNSLQEAEIEPVMAYLLITAALAIIANIVADLIYAALDPRIRVNA
ncbi:ABC transporter permease subunit [Oerskovia sp. Sa2CUA8]|uniref:ABC transporter permease subunit n=1 Tax=Oerskovia gallyi TaxID=2762226 RepID=A0ABR8UWW8_9CELL|nr:ABC transporter permease subunit [Oerskovia gallyi]